MPEAAEFLTGFGLVVNSEIAGYVLTSATATHEVIHRYQEYRYDITLTFTNSGAGNYEQLYQQLYPQLTSAKIIYGIRNPYRCTIDMPPAGFYYYGNDIIFKLVGHAHRQ